MNHQSKFIRDIFLRALENEQVFDGMLIAQINGNSFSAAEIALPDSDNRCQVYRIAVIKHG